MILRRPIATIDEIEEIERYHVESAYVTSDDLSKRILRVRTDHGNEFGIRLEDDAPPLERGMVFEVGEGRLLAIETIPDKMLVVMPRNLDEMGNVAHYLGNLHKPVEVSGGRITLLYDPVVDKDLVANGVPVEVVEMELDHPLRHIDLAKLSQGGHHHSHADRHLEDPFEHGHHHPHPHHPHHGGHGPAHHHHPHHEGRLREGAEELAEHHEEHEELRERERDEWRALHEDEHHRHRERIVEEDEANIGEHPYHHPIRHLEEDVEELGERHREHQELRELEREERWELDEEEHPHHHHAHPRTDDPR